MSSRDHPAVERIRTLATSLGELRERLVFIGGTIMPILQTDRRMPPPRPMKDVDAVVASDANFEDFREQLRGARFHEIVTEGQRAHRWRDPQGILLDLFPPESAQQWDTLATGTAIPISLGDGSAVRIASAPAFLALKWAAHNDRGAKDPLISHDLEDILALIACRPTIVAEVKRTHPDLSLYVTAQARALIANPREDDLLATGLAHAYAPAMTVEATRSRLQEIADL